MSRISTLDDSDPNVPFFIWMGNTILRCEDSFWLHGWRYFCERMCRFDTSSGPKLHRISTCDILLEQMFWVWWKSQGLWVAPQLLQPHETCAKHGTSRRTTGSFPPPSMQQKGKRQAWITIFVIHRLALYIQFNSNSQTKILFFPWIAEPKMRDLGNPIPQRSRSISFCLQTFLTKQAY